MNEALRLADELDYVTYGIRDVSTTRVMDKASDELRRLAAVEAQRDALLEALKLAWPIIEKEKFMQDGCYGKNFIQSKAERARKAYEAARAAIAKAEGEKA